MTDSPFGESSGALDRLRAPLRKEGYSAEQVEALSPEDLRIEVSELARQLELRKNVKEELPQLIAQGLLTQHQAETWPRRYQRTRTCSGAM